MARVKYGQGVSELQGRIGGTIFSRNVAGTFACNKAMPRYRLTENRMNNRPDFPSLINRYGSMPQPGRDEWDAYAVIHSHIDPWGVIKKASGWSWFSSINLNLLYLGLPIIHLPPAYEPPSVHPVSYPIFQDGEWWVGGDNMINEERILSFIYITPPLSIGCHYIQNKVRRLTCIPSETPYPFNITTLLFDYFGFVYPGVEPLITKLFGVGLLRYYINKTNGLTGLGFVYIWP